MPTKALIPPSTSLNTLQSSNDATRHAHHRRIFIGPMPEKVVSDTEAKVFKREERRPSLLTDVTDDDDSILHIPQIIKDRAFDFFIREGGNIEDWGENEERSVTNEMLKRWKDSEWGSLWKRRKERKKEARQDSNSNWVGGSFEIGTFLGVNILEEPSDLAKDANSTRSIRSRMTPSTSLAHVPTLSGGTSSFVTAPAIPVSSTPTDTEPQTPASNGSPSSSTGLLRPPLWARSASKKPRTEVIHRPIMKMPSSLVRSDTHLELKSKEQARVHYASLPVREATAPAPAPPSEVLERTGSAVDDSSAGSTIATPEHPSFDWGDVAMRDRMLVRISYTKLGSLGSQFDEIQNRMTSHLQYETWAEFMVVWRGDRMELYKDYHIPGKEWLLGHKHLAFIVPLNSSRTKLSLYSFVDLTFCITCAPTPTRSSGNKSGSLLHRSKDGTNIFVFKVKSRTRALDWTWQLWRTLGGQLPPFIEIRNPTLESRVKIEIPDIGVVESQRGLKMFTRSNVIGLCEKSLRSVGDWKTIMQRQIAQGKMLQLTWRVDTHLDWIWLENDVDGKPREWAVLCGLALKQATRKSANLELRLAQHFPSHLHLKDGSRLHEPPGIEGYLERVRPNTQTKQRIYLATHDGNIFVLPPARAHPPPPPGLQAPTPEQDTEDYAATLRQAEVKRGIAQIINANDVADLRSILIVRRAFHLVPQHFYKEGEVPHEDVDVSSQPPEDRVNSDDEDEGGEEGMSKHQDKAHLRMRRSFELLLKSGYVIRFEAHSRQVALEWIDRLRALVVYWRHRHRIDAKEEMDLAQEHRPKVTPPMHRCHDDGDVPPEPPVDPAAPSPALGSLYNWCVMEGCKPITRGGKIFMRRGLRGPYKRVQLFLVGGNLVRFRIRPNSSLHVSMRSKINLLDAYVCSGYFAALALPEGEYTPQATGVARRYQDGLETDDLEEDTLFMIWYLPQAPTIDPLTGTDATSVPALSVKRKLLVFRTRSKLERDTWCWALNCAIEKIVRAQRVREQKVREAGQLAKIS